MAQMELDLHKSPLTLPLSFALSERSTSTASYSRMASRMMFPSLLKRKSMGMVMSSVFLPSPAIWKRGAVSLLLPSLSSRQSTPQEGQTSIRSAELGAASPAQSLHSKPQPGVFSSTFHFYPHSSSAVSTDSTLQSLQVTTFNLQKHWQTPIPICAGTEPDKPQTSAHLLKAQLLCFSA